MEGTKSGPGRTPLAQEAQQIHTEVQICREMGWTRAQLYAEDEEFVWAVLTVLSAESLKMKRDSRPHPR